jgi:hypothetical protein
MPAAGANGDGQQAEPLTEGYQMHTIPEDAQRLADRLRMLADEVESAARYGVPIPYMFSVSGHLFGGASFHATDEEFDAWVDYTFGDDETATGVDYTRDGASWSRATVNVNGLPLGFACRRSVVEVAS